MSTEKKKKSSIKRILKWFSIVVLIIIIALISIPYLFKDKIVETVSNTINNNLNASVKFKDADLSLFKNFPLVSLTVNDLAVANKEPFVGDTLFNAKELSFAMKVTELFKNNNETIAIKRIASKDGNINIIFNKNGKANFDIAKKTENETSTDKSDSAFSLNIDEYELENINFNYIDRSTKTKLSLDNINHSGKGNLKDETFNLDTNTTTFLSFNLDGTNYMDHVKISLDAVIAMDLKNSKYTFKENTGYINQLPLEFDGFIQLLENSQLYNLHFKTPTSSFKNALALLPKQYAGNLSTIKTQGNFEIDGIVKGTLSDTLIPAFDVNISSKNAQFKYADLPKAVKNINIDSRIVNKTGLTKDTYVAINKLNFKIDDDAFSANGNVKNLTSNPKINIEAKGTINLANLSKVYPALEKDLEGILNADITTSFDMNSIEKESYQNIKNAGEITVRDFKYDDKDVANPFYINKTGISFNTNSIKLNEFEAKTGTSDLSIKGNLDNFYGFIFKDEVLKGNFILNSNNLKVADFIATTESTTNTDTETVSTLKIPAFLDVKLSATAKKVVYDNINLDNVSGNLLIHDETIDLKNIKSDVFGGNIGFDGNVSTKGATSKFKMDLNLKQLNVGDSFSNLEMLSSIAPIAKAIVGKINSTITVSGDLNEDMTPNLKTISGNLLGQLLNTKLKASDSKLLTTLSEKVNFLDINKLNLNEATGIFSFENGQVTVKPFNLNYKDISMQISGKHGFDQKMNYDISFDVPVKYLGTDVTNILAKLTPKDAASVTSIPVKGNLTGSFANPNFSSNIKTATTTLVKDLVEKQKNSLIEKGKDKLKDQLNNKLNGLLGNSSSKKTDSTETDSVKQDSTKQVDAKDKVKEEVKDKVKDVLGGLFGKKKKN
jgi:hypothetical protein